MMEKLRSWKKSFKIYKNILLVLLLWKKFYSKPRILKTRDGSSFLVRPGVSDIQMINEVYFDPYYQRALNELENNSTVIDIGANIGAFSISAGKLKKVTKVLSYEPFPDTFKILKFNILRNNLQLKATPFSYAVAKNTGLRNLYVSREGHATHSLFVKENNSIQIKTISLKDIFRDNKITKCHLLKIDCEGAEYESLLNSKSIIKNVKTIVLEYHPNGNPKELIEFLEKSNFSVEFRESDSKGYGFIYARNLGKSKWN